MWGVSGSDKINETNEKEVIGVHVIGKLNKEIYKCISGDIMTDEVIITDERIEHIENRHPGDYERYFGYMKDIVEHPQYILYDSVPRTAVILQEFFDGKEHFRLVMKIAVTAEVSKKNSIITFMKISKKKYKKYLRNKKVLYKRE